MERPYSLTTSIHNSESQVDKCSDYFDAYKALIYQHDANATLDNKFTVFAILDYDFSQNILKVLLFKKKTLLLIS